METKIQDQLLNLTDSIIAYLPNLLAGILLILLGWLAGWLIKRVIIQFAMIIRVDRFLKRTQWDADLSKADVRHGIYNVIGNIAYTIVFIIFVDNALLAWKLNILSDLMSKGILFIPKIIIAFVIFIAGWLLSSGVENSVLKSLHREKIPRASLISKFIKSVILLFFSAIAFVELNLAREIVIIGFASIFVTLCIISIMIVVQGGRNFIKKIEDSIKE